MSIFDEIHLNSQHGTSIAYQLKQQIAWMIINKKLEAGDQLPNIYKMAEYFGINLHTVRNAYHKLEKDGFVETRQGRGTFVLPININQLIQRANNLRSNTIGVIIPSWNNPFYHSLLEGVEEVIIVDQSLLFLCNTHDDPQNAWREFARLSSKEVDGILIVSHKIDEMDQITNHFTEKYLGIPYVTVDAPDSNGFSVNLDLHSAGYQAAKHLLSLGHKSIGLITFSVDSSNVQAINNGFFNALKEEMIAFDQNFIVRVPGFDIRDGEAGAQKLLSLNNPPTAIFAISDTLAIGAMQTIKQSGLRIPFDISIIGFNDIPLARLVDPTLTTINAPAHELGRTAMQLLKQLINKEQTQERHITLPVSLMLRQSTGKHRGIVNR